MHIVLIHLHNVLRWVIIIVALIALLKYFSGWLNQNNWGKTDNLLSLAYTAIMDLQLLTGLLLYFVYSPITQAAFQDLGAAMQNRDLRYYAVEHFTIMLIAIILAHIGRVRSKKAKGSKAKYRNALIFFGLSYLVLMLGIPWVRVI